MTKKEIRMALRRQKQLAQQLDGIGPVMRGSIVKIGTRNKQFYFTLNKDRKTHLIYLGNQREPIARRLSDNYKKLLAVIEDMTVLNMQLLKNDALK